MLVHGATRHDASWPALLAVQAEWLRTDRGYAERIASLRDGGGLNGGTRLTGATVLDDLFRDALLGGPGSDWFWGKLAPGIADSVRDREADEVIN